MFFFSSYNFWHQRCQATRNEMYFAYKSYLTNIASRLFHSNSQRVSDCNLSPNSFPLDDTDGSSSVIIIPWMPVRRCGLDSPEWLLRVR